MSLPAYFSNTTHDRQNTDFGTMPSYRIMSRFLHIVFTSMMLNNIFVQRQTLVTSHFSSKQLLLFTFTERLFSLEHTRICLLLTRGRCFSKDHFTGHNCNLQALLLAVTSSLRADVSTPPARIGSPPQLQSG